MTPSRVDGVPVFDRKQARRFPESGERKQVIRAGIAPEQSPGCRA